MKVSYTAVKCWLAPMKGALLAGGCQFAQAWFTGDLLVTIDSNLTGKHGGHVGKNAFTNLHCTGAQWCIVLAAARNQWPSVTTNVLVHSRWLSHW